MNLSFLIEKNHIFKSRKQKLSRFKYSDKKYSTISNEIQLRFELINLKIIKKLFRKSYFKRRMRFVLSKYWVMIKPNFLLTMKSKNSRMGSGVGLYVRVSSIIKPNTSVILIKNHSSFILKKIIKYFKKKMNINFYLNYSKL